MKSLNVSHVLSLSSLTLLLACGQASVDPTNSDSLGLSAEAEEQLASLGLTEDGARAETEEAAHPRRQGFVDQLSPAAKNAFDKVKITLDQIRDEKEKICAHDSELRKNLSDQLKVIRDDSTLNASEKQIKKQELLAASKVQFEASKTAFHQCVADHESQLQVFNDKADGIVKACGLPDKKSRKEMRNELSRRVFEGHGKKEAKKAHGSQDGQNRAAQIQALEQSLVTDACSTLL